MEWGLFMRYMIVAILLIALSGCATKINPMPPQAGAFDKPVPGKTTVFVPVGIDLQAIERLVNDNFPNGQLHADSGRSGNSLEYDYQVYRRGNIAVAASDGKLNLTVPIYAKARATKVICLGWWSGGRCRGGKTSEHADTEARADGIIDLHLSVSPDYTVKVTADTKLELRNRPHLHMDLFGSAIRINIDITDKIQSTINSTVPKLRDMVQAQIDRQLQTVDLRKVVNDYWPTLQQPIEAGDAWVQFVPEKVVFRGFHSDPARRQLRVGLGVQGELRVSLTKPDAVLAAIPPVEPTSQSDAVFSVLVPVHSAFVDLERELNAKVGGLQLRDDRNYVKIDQVRLNGTVLDGKAAILVGVKFHGGRDVSWYDRFLKRVKGTLYFVAAPEYDAAKRVIYADDFDMTADTSSAILNAGLPWLIQLKKDQIRQSLQYELGPQIDKIRNLLEAELGAGRDVGPATIFGTVRDLGFGGFYVDGDEIELYVNASGGVSLKADAPQ